MDNVTKTYHESGNIQSEHWFNETDQLHRIDGPAKIWYFNSGNIVRKFWYINGKLIEPPFDNYPLTKEQIIEMKLIHG